VPVPIVQIIQTHALPQLPLQRLLLQRLNFETATIDPTGTTIRKATKSAERYIEALGNGINLEMVKIPAGHFIMGAPETERGSGDSERPQHRVNVKSFLMGRYPIMQEQWEIIAKLEPIVRELNPDPSGFKGAKRPVERVIWKDAMEFCGRLTKLTGKNYRLPSEAEWEYAAYGYMMENPQKKRNKKERGEEVVANKQIYAWKNDGFDNLRYTKKGSFQGAYLQRD
jgi:formylglycine-generating enzyme required for sulfatase activity